MRIFGIIVLSFIIVGVFIIGVAALRGGLASFFGRMQAEVDIESADSRIANYTAFFNRCAAVQGYEDQLTVLEDQLQETPESDTEEVNRLRQSIAGLEGQRARAIRRYNSEATQDYTAARFRDSDLPYQLSIEGTNTCAAR